MMKTLYDLGLADKFIGNKKLGCAMLKTDSPIQTVDPKLLKLMKEEEYVSPDKNHSWIKGIEQDHHVTVRYGFLPGVTHDDFEKTVGDMPVYGKLFIVGWEIFTSPWLSEPYECVVALIKPNTHWLLDLNRQLSVLPNLVTFPEYKPHVTVGYFNKGFWTADFADRYLNDSVRVGAWKFSEPKDD